MPANTPSLNETIIGAQQPTFDQIASREKLVHWAEESQFALEAFQKNPSLQKCSPQSIRNAIINVATCGLTLNPANGLAYLVPEYNKQTRQSVCQLRISFKGLCKVAIDSGAIQWVRAEIVRANDRFDYLGPCREPNHLMNPFATNRGEVVGVYCIAKTASGDVLADVMSRADIDKIKAAAKTQNVWNSWYEEMAKKAIIKRASKQWPSASNAQRFQETVATINKAEGNVIEGESTPTVAYYPDEDFQKFLPDYRAAIESGNWTVEKVAEKIATRAPLSPQQIKQLQRFVPEEK